MKKSRLLGAVCAGVVSILSHSAHAVIVGDKDWMQVTATTGYSWNDFNAIFNTTTGQCDVAGCLLGGVVDLTGYTWASNQEVDSLIQTYGGQPLPTLELGSSVTDGVDALDSFFADFDPTFMSGTSTYILGRARTDPGGVGEFVFGLTNGQPGSYDTHRLEISFSKTESSAVTGGYLYTAAVPIPPALWLFGSGLLGLIGVARRKVRV